MYFPVDTSSNFSNSAWSTHYIVTISPVFIHPFFYPTGLSRRGRFQHGRAKATNLAGKVNFHGLDANILGTGAHCDRVNSSRNRKSRNLKSIQLLEEMRREKRLITEKSFRFRVEWGGLMRE